MTETVQDLAKMIDHSLLHPTMTDEQLKAGCGLAIRYQTASVCIKPYAVRMAAELLEGSGVLTGAVIGFPHGNSSTETKVFETERVCRDGAVEVDMVVNIGKVLGRDWEYVGAEIQAVYDTSHENGAILKVIFENDFVTEDSFKIRLCEICTAVGVEFVKTSTGYGFVQRPDRTFFARGATDHDLQLMRKHCGPHVQIKAAGGIRTLDDLLRVMDLGVTRVGATATEVILEEAEARFGQRHSTGLTG